MSENDSRQTGVMWSALLAPYRKIGLSLQEQVRQMLVASILDGLLMPQGLLPSTRKLAQSLGVSRNTIIIVYQRLSDEGYLVARPRGGYYVAAGVQEAAGDISVHPSGNGRCAWAAGPDISPDWAVRFLHPPSRQRHIEKRSDWHKYPYPFLYGQFDAGSFPMVEWRQCCLRTLNALAVSEWGRDMLQEDDAGLIHQIRTRLLLQRGIQVDEASILVTVGSQHALYLLADLLVDQKTRVGIEDPGYPDARNIFLRRRAWLSGIPVDQEGMRPEAALAACDYLYVTPSRQSPTMVQMSMARREALLAQAREHDIVIIEDDYETGSGYMKASMPALKSLDRDGRVVYLGSFSKSVAPGLRLGYLVGPVPLVLELRSMRRLSIRHPNAFIQRVMAQFLAMGHYHSLQRRLGNAYAERAVRLREAMARYLPCCRIQACTGGSAFWIEGPRELDSSLLCSLAERQGVLIEAGDVFFIDPGQGGRFFRMGFTSIEAADIEEGVRRLASVFAGACPPGGQGT